MPLDMPEITGVQIVYAGAGNALDWLPESEGRCRICGGRLLAPLGDACKHGSDNWTDENLVMDIASDRICAACLWMAKNRNYISGAKALYAAPGGNRKLPELEDLFEALRQPFATPAVFVATGYGAKAHYKHVMLRANRAVTWSRANTHVVAFGLNMTDKLREIVKPYVLATWGPSTAVLSFDADRLVPVVERLTSLIQPLCRQLLEQRKKTPKKNALVITAVNEYTRAHGEALLDPLARFAVRVAAERAATAEGVKWEPKKEKKKKEKEKEAEA